MVDVKKSLMYQNTISANDSINFSCNYFKQKVEKNDNTNVK